MKLAKCLSIFVSALAAWPAMAATGRVAGSTPLDDLALVLAAAALLVAARSVFSGQSRRLPR